MAKQLPYKELFPTDDVTHAECRKHEDSINKLQTLLYIALAALVLCFSLIMTLTALWYQQFLLSRRLSARIESLDANHITAPRGGDEGQWSPPGGAVGAKHDERGLSPRGADQDGGPWQYAPRADYDDGYYYDDDDEEEEREEEMEEDGTRADGGQKRIKRSSGKSTVDHLYGHPNSIQSTGDMFRHWRVAKWSTGSKNVFNTTTGMMTIVDPGVYWVYAQVVFYNSAYENGYAVQVIRNTSSTQTGTSNDTPENLVMCIHTTDYNHANQTRYNSKYRTCNVGIPALLNVGDRLGVASLYVGRQVVFSPASSFFGLIKYGPNS